MTDVGPNPFDVRVTVEVIANDHADREHFDPGTVATSASVLIEGFPWEGSENAAVARGDKLTDAVVQAYDAAVAGDVQTRDENPDQTPPQS